MVVLLGAMFLVGCAPTEVAEPDRPKSQTQELATRAITSEDGHTYELVTIGNTRLTLVDGTTYMLADDIVLSDRQVEMFLIPA